MAVDLDFVVMTGAVFPQWRTIIDVKDANGSNAIVVIVGLFPAFLSDCLSCTHDLLNVESEALIKRYTWG